MYVIAVANSKGGSGKTTVATHLAAWFAGQGLRTGLGDLDKQHSSRSWVKRRPASAQPVAFVDLDEFDGKKTIEIPGQGKLDRLVVDAVAAMKQAVVAEVVKRADLVVIPVLPSIFDEDGTKRFMDQLQKLKPIRKNRREVCFVANRVKPRTRAGERLEAFLEGLEFPVVARLRDSQVYANAALSGLSLFDLKGSRLRALREDWEPLLRFCQNGAAETA